MTFELNGSFRFHPPSMISTITVKLANEIIISLKIKFEDWSLKTYTAPLSMLLGLQGQK